MSGVTQLDKESKQKMLDAGLSEDETKLVEAFRYIAFGQITAYKKENKLSGRIDIKTTY